MYKSGLDRVAQGGVGRGLGADGHRSTQEAGLQQ